MYTYSAYMYFICTHYIYLKTAYITLLDICIRRYWKVVSASIDGQNLMPETPLGLAGLGIESFDTIEFDVI